MGVIWFRRLVKPGHILLYEGGGEKKRRGERQKREGEERGGKEGGGREGSLKIIISNNDMEAK